MIWDGENIVGAVMLGVILLVGTLRIWQMYRIPSVHNRQLRKIVDESVPVKDKPLFLAHLNYSNPPKLLEQKDLLSMPIALLVLGIAMTVGINNIMADDGVFALIFALLFAISGAFLIGQLFFSVMELFLAADTRKLLFLRLNHLFSDEELELIQVAHTKSFDSKEDLVYTFLDEEALEGDRRIYRDVSNWKILNPINLVTVLNKKAEVKELLAVYEELEEMLSVDEKFLTSAQRQENAELEQRFFAQLDEVMNNFPQAIERATSNEQYKKNRKTQKDLETIGQDYEWKQRKLRDTLEHLGGNEATKSEDVSDEARMLLYLARQTHSTPEMEDHIQSLINTLKERLESSDVRHTKKWDEHALAEAQKRVAS